MKKIVGGILSFGVLIITSGCNSGNSSYQVNQDLLAKSYMTFTVIDQEGDWPNPASNKNVWPNISNEIYIANIGDGAYSLYSPYVSADKGVPLVYLDHGNYFWASNNNGSFYELTKVKLPYMQNGGFYWLNPISSNNMTLPNKNSYQIKFKYQNSPYLGTLSNIPDVYTITEASCNFSSGNITSCDVKTNNIVGKLSNNVKVTYAIFNKTLQTYLPQSAPVYCTSSATVSVIGTDTVSFKDCKVPNISTIGLQMVIQYQLPLIGTQNPGGIKMQGAYDFISKVINIDQQ